MGPHDDDGSGATLLVALRAEPAYPATAAVATAAATPSANSENFLLNAPSSIDRPEIVRTAGKSPCLPLTVRPGSISRSCPGFKRGRSGFRDGQRPPLAGPTMGIRPRRWRNWSTRWPQKPLSFGTCGFESHPPHQTVDYGRAARSKRL